MRRDRNMAALAAGILALAVLSAAPAAAQSASATGLTIAVTEGPYYVSGTGVLPDGNLNAAGLPGTAIKIVGHVYAGATGTVPVKNAKIELWQADDRGVYHPQGNGAATRYTKAQIALRGYVTSGADGSYSFASIYPGYYEGRARHIHFRVTADGYRSVTSQLIFLPKAGDRVTYSTDSIAQSLPGYQLLRLDGSASPETGSFDIRLTKD